MSDRTREETSLRGPERSAELIKGATMSDRTREDTSLLGAPPACGGGPERSAELIKEVR